MASSIGSSILSSINLGGASSTGITGTTTGTGTGAGINVQATVAQIIAGESVPQTLLLNQQATLAGETAILQSIAGNLTSLQTQVNSLSDPVGAFNTLLATSSQTGVVTVSADNTASAGNHTIQVSNLASTASVYTAAQPTSSTALATGAFTLQVGSGNATTITVDSTNNTLAGLATSINSQNLGVSASVVNDVIGARLALVSNTSGSAGNITISGDTTGLGFTTAITGQDAQLTVDGVPVSSSSNTVTGVLQGVTLTLNSASPGTPVAVSIAPDTAAVTQAINNFVTAYNTINTAINQQFAVDANGNGGNLVGDSGLSTLQAQLFSDLNYSVSGNNGLVNLGSIGVNLQNDGSLLVDNTALSSALSTNFSSVKNLFQSTGTTPGLAQNFSTNLLALTDPTQGPISLELTGISAQQQDLTTQLNDFSTYITAQQTQLTTEYSLINASLQALPALEAQISSELASVGH